MKYLYLLCYLFFSLFFHSIIHAQRIYDYNWRDFQLQGKEHLKFERYDVALYYFEKAERWARNDSSTTEYERGELFGNIGDCLQILGKEFEARDYYESSLDAGFIEPARILFLARFYRKRRNYSVSIRYFANYFELKPTDMQAVWEHAQTKALHEGRDSAKQFLQTWREKRSCEISVRPTDTQLTCLDEFRRKYAGHPENSFAYVRALSAAGNSDEAMKIAEWLYTIFGDDPRYAWPAATLFYQKKKYSKAEEVLLEILEKESLNRQALELLYAIALETDNENKADRINKMIEQSESLR
ncbi:MAG: hypothetical protein KDK41_10235 [Leptospiraceae bacterium]|nr:hypothetical protein [Leptospiraceae bacterium]